MNTTELINALKIHGSFPASNDLFSPEDFLVLFNHQLKIDITPIMLKLNEEYFVRYKEFEILAGATYRIPKRAIGTNIRDLKVVSSSGNMSDLNRLYEEDRAFNKTGYYVVGNSVELSPDIQGGMLKMAYFARPSSLVLPSACAEVQSIDVETSSITVVSAPSTFQNEILVDFVQNNNPYDLLGMDFSLVGVSGTVFSFASLPSGIEPGDWICLATQSPVPMIPEELHPVLVQSTLCKTLSSKKDKQWENEMGVLDQNKKDAINMLDPRVQNNSNKMRSGKIFNFVTARRY